MTKFFIYRYIKYIFTRCSLMLLFAAGVLLRRREIKLGSKTPGQ